jgi:hypothetical protein
MKAKLANDPAARVRRVLASGAPARIVTRPEPMPVMEAVGRLVEAVDKGRQLMADEGLNRDDITAGLVHTTIETGEFGCKWLPVAPGQIGEYVTDFERMAARGTLQFLGILWQQKRGDGGGSLWVKPLMGGDAAKLQLQAVMNVAAAQTGFKN